MPKVGTRGLDMMYRTCDRAGEPRLRAPRPTWSRSCACRWRCSRSRRRSSPTRPSPRASRTASCPCAREIWRDTDNDRTGMLPFAFEDGFGFERYVDWALDVPMYFVKRDGTLSRRRRRLVPRLPRRQARRSCRASARRMSRLGEPPLDAVPRGAPEALSRDARRRCRPAGAHRALSAFWAGLLYDDAALDGAWELVKGWSAEEREALRADVPRLALDAEVAGRPVRDVARDALALSRAGLQRRAMLDADGARRDPLPRPARRDRRPRPHRRRGPARPLPRRLAPFGRAGFRGVRVLRGGAPGEASIRPAAAPSRAGRRAGSRPATMSPPCERAMSRAMARPRPEPPSSWLRASSSRTKGLKTSSRWSGGMPGPSSSTWTISQRVSWLAEMAMRVAVARGVDDEVDEQPPEGVGAHRDHRVADDVEPRRVALALGVGLQLFEQRAQVGRRRPARRHRRARRRDSPRACGSSRRCRCLRSSTSGVSSSSASESLKRVRMVRRSWLTPLSIVVRCSMARSMRRFISRKAWPAWRTSRAPRGRNSISRPLPKLSAASASRRIGRIWLRRNRIAMPSSTSDEPPIQTRKMCEFEA